MKIVRYNRNGITKYGILECGFIYQAVGDVYGGETAKGELIGGLGKVDIVAPCEPKSITSIGANYASRCRQNNLPIPDVPGKGDRFFIPVEALTGPNDFIFLPRHETRIEYSGELGIVIKKSCSKVKEEEVSNYILGYTIIHNVWAKDEKGSTRSPRQRLRAYKTFCPVGPCICTDIDAAAIPWQTRVNGVIRQQSVTSEMLFTVEEIVANISTWHTLQPGDLIQCGTATGVGQLYPGDVVEIEYEGIGVLRNIAIVGDNMRPLDLIWIDEYKGD